MMLRDQLKTMIAVTPLRSVEITERSGQTRTAVNRCLGRLRKKGMIHIAAWYKDRHIVAAMYKWGPGIDAERPKPTPVVTLQRKYYRNRVDRNPDYYKKVWEKRKAKKERPVEKPVERSPVDNLLLGWGLGRKV